MGQVLQLPAGCPASSLSAAPWQSQQPQRPAAVQAELGERAATGVVSLSHPEEGPPDVQFEAFQVLPSARRAQGLGARI